jgi:hypothetical protein
VTGSIDPAARCERKIGLKSLNVKANLRRPVGLTGPSLLFYFFRKAAFLDLIKHGWFQEPECFGSLTRCFGIGFRCFLNDEHQPATVGEVQDPFAWAQLTLF